jgi:hypothetical protein
VYRNRYAIRDTEIPIRYDIAYRLAFPSVQPGYSNKFLPLVRLEKSCHTAAHFLHIANMSSSELFDDISDSFSATSSPQLPRHGSRSPERSPSPFVSSSLRRKRGRTAHDTWSHSRNPRPGEPERDSKRARYWYCCYCENPMYRTLSTTSARRHLDKVHNIQLEAAEPAIKKKRDVHIRQIFEKQAVKAIMRSSRVCFIKALSPKLLQGL